MSEISQDQTPAPECSEFPPVLFQCNAFQCRVLLDSSEHLVHGCLCPKCGAPVRVVPFKEAVKLLEAPVPRFFSAST